MALILVVATVVSVMALYLVLSQPFPTPNAAPATDLDPQPPVRAKEFCSVALCADDVTIHLHVANETWPFCLTHGMPYLVPERAA